MQQERSGIFATHSRRFFHTFLLSSVVICSFCGSDVFSDSLRKGGSGGGAVVCAVEIDAERRSGGGTLRADAIVTSSVFNFAPSVSLFALCVGSGGGGGRPGCDDDDDEIRSRRGRVDGVVVAACVRQSPISLTFSHSAIRGRGLGATTQKR